jgi:hypothetical protein
MLELILVFFLGFFYASQLHGDDYPYIKLKKKKKKKKTSA